MAAAASALPSGDPVARGPARGQPAASARRTVGDPRRLSSTALSSGNSLASFGVTAVRPGAAKTMRMSTVSLVREIRSRIPEFITDGHFPRQFSDFLSYLKSRSLSLETRVDNLGNRANYVTDERSGRSVPAADVDSRLSVSGIARLFGVSMEKTAEQKYQSLSDEQKRALDIRRQHAGRLLDKSSGNAFVDWADVVWSAPVILKGEVSVFGDEAWVGPAMATASDDPAENLEIIAQARASGVKIIPPARTREDALAGRFVAGMPILLSAKATRLRLIDEELDHGTLTRNFGRSIFDHYEALAKSSHARQRTRQDQQASAADFMKRFGKKKRRTESDVVMHRGITVMHEVTDAGRERMMVIHLDGSQARFDPRVLAPGRYAKEDPYGLPSGGYIEVKEGGTAFAHLDGAGRLHNETGPAVVTLGLSGAVQSAVYALDGATMDAQTYGREMKQRSAIVQETPAPEVMGLRPSYDPARA